MTRGLHRRAAGGLLVAVLAAPSSGQVVEALTLAREGLLHEAAAPLARALQPSASAPRARAAQAVSEWALRHPRPWTVLSRLREGRLGNASLPEESLDLALLELELVLRTGRVAAEELLARAREPAAPAEEARLARLARRHLPSGDAVRVLTALVRREPGEPPPRVGTVHQLCGELLEAGRTRPAARVARSFLRAIEGPEDAARQDLRRVAALLDPDPAAREEHRRALRGPLPPPRRPTPAGETTPEPALQLHRLRALAGRPDMVPALRDVLETLPDSLPFGAAAAAGRLALSLDALSAEERVRIARARLPGLEASLVAWSLAAPGSPEADAARAGALAAAATRPVLDPGFAWLVEVARSRDAGPALLPLLEDRVRDAAGAARSRLLEWAATLHRDAGAPSRALMARLQDLELAPEDPTKVEAVLDLLEPRVRFRHMLHAWWARVENDPRFGIPMARFWARTGKPRRGHWPLLKARRAAPRDARVAAALGALLADLGKPGEGLGHLEAAARLDFYRYSPDASPFLARELARAGRTDEVLDLYTLWLAEHPEPAGLTGELAALADAFEFRPAAAPLLQAHLAWVPPATARPTPLPGLALAAGD